LVAGGQSFHIFVIIIMTALTQIKKNS